MEKIGEVNMTNHSMKIDKSLAVATKHWKYVAPILSYPKNSKEYDAASEMLDQLLDVVDGDEKHPLMSLVDALSHNISSYDDQHHEIKSKGLDALLYLMKINHLTQSDLPEIGSQGVVSEILNSKRKLNLKQMIALSKRFKLDPSTFIDVSNDEKHD